MTILNFTLDTDKLPNGIGPRTIERLAACATGQERTLYRITSEVAGLPAINVTYDRQVARRAWHGRGRHYVKIETIQDAGGTDFSADEIEVVAGGEVPA